MEMKKKMREAKQKQSSDGDGDASVGSGVSGGVGTNMTTTSSTMSLASTSTTNAIETHAEISKILLEKEKEIEKLKKRIQDQRQQNETRLFSHLTPFKPAERVAINHDIYHPAIVSLALQFANGVICGSNARCVAFMQALKQFVLDYETPKDKVLVRDLDAQLIPQIDFLKRFRPMSIGMGNALKNFKFELHRMDPSTSDDEAKEFLVNVIDGWISEKIEYTMKSIVEKGVQKIQTGDIILTYARSEAVERIFLAAKDEGKDFTVVVVNSRPKNEGVHLLKNLTAHGIKCSFCSINAVSYMMKDVTSVILGAHGMFNNGNVLSRVGTAMICLAARSYNKPVLVCCETYKFSDKSQLDSITRNELSDPKELTIPDREDVRQKFVRMGLYGDAGEYRGGSVLNLTYDVTPGEWIDVVVTEVGFLPCTSVPVIIREIYAQNQAQ